MSVRSFDKYASKESYEAFGCEEQQQSRIRIHYQDGTIGLIAVSYIIEVLATSHQYLSIICSNCIITLEGRNLNAMIEPLQDDLVRFIRCYHPTKHDQPNDGEPLILSIERKSLIEDEA